MVANSPQLELPLTRALFFRIFQKSRLTGQRLHIPSHQKLAVMNLVQRIEHWGDTHHPQWLDAVRILLGVFLCYKGVDFLMNMGTMLNLITNKMSFGSFSTMLMSNYVAFAHILGGVLLILGVLTRFACLIQIPILLGAIFFVGADLNRPY